MIFWRDLTYLRLFFMQIFVKGCFFFFFCIFVFVFGFFLKYYVLRVVLSSIVIFCRLSCVKDSILIILI